jgi:hypothetical protein
MAATWRLTVPGMQVHGNVRRRGQYAGSKGGSAPAARNAPYRGIVHRARSQERRPRDTAGVDPAS